MNDIGMKFKLSALTLAMLASGSVAYAAENQVQNTEEQSVEVAEVAGATKNKKEESDGLEIITVSGFRGSLIKAMSEKRNTTNVSDSIFAEDIGKSTDQNIADALSRVTGVSVQSEDGEGTQITVRGANPNQNMITLNGVQLTSADFNQAVDLSSFSADILSSISVIKTPSADHDEGSLGASVRLVTTKPLDISKDRQSLTLQGRYNDFSENEDYKISGTFSRKFFDETFGFLVTAFKETNSVRRDEMVISNFQKRELVAARDQHGNIHTDIEAIGPTQVAYNLFENNRDRVGFNSALQWLPTDTTNVMLDINYSKFTGTDVTHGVVVRDAKSSSLNFEEGVPSFEKLNGAEFIPTFSDPTHEWTTINTDTNTILKQLRRFGDGGYNRRNASADTTNKQVSLRIEQEITDDLRFEFGVNSSETTLRPDPSFAVGLLSGGNPTAGKILAGPESDPLTGIQPAGYDCTSGICEMVFGDGLITVNDPTNIFDNTSRATWNPDDLDSHTTNGFSILDNKVDDKQTTAYIDFDWDVDFVGITKIETGFKYRERTKTSNNQRYRILNTSRPVIIDQYDSDGNLTGTQVLNEGGSLSSIPASTFAFEGEFPYDNFMQDLGVPVSTLTDGWALVSATKLQELAQDIDNLVLDPDPGEFRETALEHQAAYVKFSYEYLDGKLTGDVGVRYIKTESTSAGNSKAQFAGDNALGRVFDPFLWKQLRDRSNTPCEIAGRPRPFGQWSGYSRIDGLGWSNTAGDTPEAIPADPNYPCFDETTLFNSAGTWLTGRHEDISRHPFYIWDDGDIDTREDRSLVTFATNGGNSYDMYLPSLNVNYQVNQDLIARFAVSKTISRANIDSLRPGFTLNENFWSPHDAASGTINLFNPQLAPQESKNLDLSLEWYFNKTGLLSAAIFVKDMSNFEESENALVYAEDLRYVDLTQPYDVAGLTLTEEQVRTQLQNPELVDGIGKAACFPDRGNNSSVRQEWFYDESDGMLGWCSQFTASRLKNGKGAEIKGLELGYQQNYDFLPGIWSGLGTTINYTYQSSKTDKEFSSFDATKELPQYPREWTPEHSYNATLFWEKWGHQIRLAFRGKSDELVQRTWNEGSLWRESSTNLDFSAAYKISETMQVSFQAINLTDASTRNYFTSRTINLNGVEFDEGNPLEDSSITKSRTQRLLKTGRTFRIDLRVDF